VPPVTFYSHALSPFRACPPQAGKARNLSSIRAAPQNEIASAKNFSTSYEILHSRLSLTSCTRAVTMQAILRQQTAPETFSALRYCLPQGKML
jgi:hypothetical protein